MGFEEGILAVERADWIALVISAATGILVVLGLLTLRRAALARTRFRLLVNACALFALLAAVVSVVQTYVLVSTFLIERVLLEDARRKHVGSAAEFAKPMARDRAVNIISNSPPFVCAYPGWVVWAIALGAVPAGAILHARIIRLRRAI